MKKIMKVTMAVAGVCIVAGLGLSLAGYAMGGEPGFWIGRNGMYTNQQARNLNAEKLVELEKTKIDPFTSMDVRVNYNGIKIKPSEDDSYYLEYHLYIRNKEPEYTIKNGILSFTCVPEPTNSETWGSAGFLVIEGSYVHDREDGSVTIYVPKDTPMDAVKLYTSDSSVIYDGPDTKTLDITSKYGSIDLSGIKAETAYFTASDGAIYCDSGTFTSLDIINKYGETDLNSIEADRLDIDASDSQIVLKDIVSRNITVTNKYGSIKGSAIVSDSMTMKQSDGSCDIRMADIKNGDFENKYGDITLELTGAEKDYNFDLMMKYGDINLNGRNTSEKDLRENNGADKNIAMTANDGSMRITTK